MEKRLRNIWWAFLGILLIVAFLKFLLPVKSPSNANQLVKNGELKEREIVVYITGAVENSGLLHLPIDARLNDALDKAQIRSDADIEALNPAQKLKDGQKIIIPRKIVEGEIGTAQDMAQNTRVGLSTHTEGTGGNSIRPVNINVAGLGELDAIPGIGPALAQRIIDYRQQNGLFSSIEEIQNVSGIGSKTFEKMEQYITVGL